MKNVNKYERQYFMPPVCEYDWAKKDHIEKAPVWCSVDLRDGNQALIEPMSLDEKLEFFQMLVDIGFKEIEVGFPAASETEFIFMRTLIERDMIPDDVTVQVLTQAREHIIKKTFEAVKGAPHAVIHLYNSTSVAQREQVFKKSKEQIMQLAVDGAELLKKLADETEGDFSFEYSPESFHGTEVDYAVEVCNAVLDVWQPTAQNKAIINIPATVETAMPHVFATQIEYVSKNLKYRDNVVLSLHPHNDRGCGVSDAELGLLAGADRIEGTLFGNGERTGNVDIITVAMNMYSYGIDPQLDFSNMPHIREVYEKVRKTESYEEFISQYVERYVYASDKKMVHDFLSSEGLEERLVDGCMEKDLPYRRITGKDKNAYVWMEAKKYIDANENTAIITLHNEKIVQNTVIKMERELIKKEQDMAKQYWDMVSLLTTVLNHNQIVESGYQDDISFYTKQVYLQLQKNYPEYGITDEEISSVAHLAPIHDIGKIKVPIEILNKNGKLTDEEMNVVKQHPLVGAVMTQRFPEGITTKKLNKYSYEICRHHHERYDGSGYPDGLKGNAIPMCAQVVGIVDAYDALINDRPYKRKYEPEEAIQMISNGECGAFSKKLIQCLTAAAKQPEWLKVTKSQA